jgi:prepilin-type N-terminal cleavage/methylation domain-containing protein
MMKKRVRPGFTLIELLIAIVIFSGVMILSIATFARSATSSYKVSAVREKTEAARRLVDQISNDFQYIYAPQTGGLYSNDDCTTPPAHANIKGYCLLGTSDGIDMLLRYPGDTDLTRKRYKIDSTGSRSTLVVSEMRGCNINNPITGGAGSCPTGQLQNSQNTRDALDSKFALDYTASSPVFSGASVLGSERGYLKIDLTVKPLGSTTCTNLSGDSCYRLKTTVTAGGV